MALHETLRTAEAFPAEKKLRRRSPVLRWALYGAGVLLLAFVAWHFIAPLFEAKPRRAALPPVKVAKAEQRDVTVMANTIGTVVSPAMVQVTAQVGGKLLAANFHEGDMVRKGALLFQIDPAPYEAALAQVQGQLTRDTATLANAKVDLTRYQTLSQQGAVSNQQLETQQATVKADEGVVASDQANLQTAKINLTYTRIVSPIDGKTGAIFIQPGNVITVATATTQPLVTITQVQPVKVSFFLPQNTLAQLQDQLTQGKLVATVPIAGREEKAPVDFISNQVNAATGTIELRANFPNADMRLVPGQTVTVSASIRHILGATVVPRDAVNAAQDSSFVLVVDKDSKIASKTVKVLNDDGMTDAISGDIKPGDTVVTDGQLRVTPGQKVRVARGKAAPKSASDNDTP